MSTEAEDLYNELAHSSFLIFKGDLNYRKLTGDREWPHDIEFKVFINLNFIFILNFKTSLCGFEPAPLLTLRTLKAETVVGLPKQSIEKIDKKFSPNDRSWMYSSEYAVAQLLSSESELNMSGNTTTSGESSDRYSLINKVQLYFATFSENDIYTIDGISNKLKLDAKIVDFLRLGPTSPDDPLLILDFLAINQQQRNQIHTALVSFFLKKFKK